MLTIFTQLTEMVNKVSPGTCMSSALHECCILFPLRTLGAKLREEDDIPDGA